MSTEEPRDGFTQTQGIRLHYLEWGSADAPDLLLVHGWTSFSKTWAAVAAHLHDRYHIVAPDLRGHGESDKPATGYRLRDFVEDIRQLIENLGLDKPAYVGHSWGGNIGTMMAAQHPDAISRAFLEDPVYWKMINAFVTNLPKATARLDWPEADIRADAIKQGLSDEQASHEVYRHHHFSREAVTRLLTDNREWAFACEDHLRRIAVPTLVLAGDVEAGAYMLPEELAYYRRIASSNVEFRHWKQVGHMMHDARPEQYNEELAAFLAE